MSKKSGPVQYSKLLYKIGEDFLKYRMVFCLSKRFEQYYDNIIYNHEQYEYIVL